MCRCVGIYSCYYSCFGIIQARLSGQYNACYLIYISFACSRNNCYFMGEGCVCTLPFSRHKSTGIPGHSNVGIESNMFWRGWGLGSHWECPISRHRIMIIFWLYLTGRSRVDDSCWQHECGTRTIETKGGTAEDPRERAGRRNGMSWDMLTGVPVSLTKPMTL